MTHQELLQRSSSELVARIQEHHNLLCSLMDGRKVKTETCHLVGCPHRYKLRATIAEVIVTLEQTRRSFKSRQLEALRRKLIDVLAEDGE